MMAIIGLDETILAEICRDTNTVIANINSPGQLVISGATENIAIAGEMAKAKVRHARCRYRSAVLSTPP